MAKKDNKVVVNDSRENVKGFRLSDVSNYAYNEPVEETNNKKKDKQHKDAFNTIRDTHHVFSNKYPIFMNLLDNKEYDVYINVQRNISIDTTFELIIQCIILNEEEEEEKYRTIADNIFKAQSKPEVESAYEPISDYNAAILNIKEIVKDILDKTLNDFVKDKYITNIRVSIRDTKLKNDLDNFFDGLLILKNAPKTTCIF